MGQAGNRTLQIDRATYEKMRDLTYDLYKLRDLAQMGTTLEFGSLTDDDVALLEDAADLLNDLSYEYDGSLEEEEEEDNGAMA